MATEERMFTTLKTLSKKSVAAGTKKGADDLCKQYMTLRPLIVAVLPFIEKIPLYGKKIADVIRFLMSIADKICPATIKASRT